MRILLADDERDLVAALEELLNHERYTVDAVYNGQDGAPRVKVDDARCAGLKILISLSHTRQYAAAMAVVENA